MKCLDNPFNDVDSDRFRRVREDLRWNPMAGPIEKPMIGMGNGKRATTMAPESC
jgi:hypothetical protein